MFDMADAPVILPKSASAAGARRVSPQLAWHYHPDCRPPPDAGPAEQRVQGTSRRSTFRLASGAVPLPVARRAELGRPRENGTLSQNDGTPDGGFFAFPWREPRSPWIPRPRGESYL